MYVSKSTYLPRENYIDVFTYIVGPDVKCFSYSGWSVKSVAAAWINVTVIFAFSRCLINISLNERMASGRRWRKEQMGKTGEADVKERIRKEKKKKTPSHPFLVQFHTPTILLSPIFLRSLNPLDGVFLFLFFFNNWDLVCLFFSIVTQACSRLSIHIYLINRLKWYVLGDIPAKVEFFF